MRVFATSWATIWVCVCMIIIELQAYATTLIASSYTSGRYHIYKRRRLCAATISPRSRHTLAASNCHPHRVEEDTRTSAQDVSRRRGRAVDQLGVSLGRSPEPLGRQVVPSNCCFNTRRSQMPTPGHEMNRSAQLPTTGFPTLRSSPSPPS